MQIFWVEDVPNEVLSIISTLVRAGHSVVIKRTRDAAVQCLDKGWRGDLIVLDSFLPEDDAPPSHSGVELFKEIRSGKWGEWGEKVCVVFVTGYAQLVQKRIEKVEPPAADVLGKPLGKREALEALAKTVPGLNIESNTGNITINLQVGVLENVSQSSGASLTSSGLSKEQIALLRSVAMRWIEVGDENSIEAAERALHIVKQSGNSETQGEAIKSFKRWLSDKGDEVKEGLATSSNLVAIGTPIAILLLQLLGLQ